MDDSYRQALERYHASPVYRNLHRVVGPAILALQAWTLWSVPWGELHWVLIVVISVWAYLLTDLVNGFVHLHMDHSTAYDSFVGPLIAVFHQHHVKPRYTDNPVLVVYAGETGFKNWLLFWLAGTAGAQAYGLSAGFSLLLALTGVFSSVAEVSHYLAHNSTHPLVRFLQRVGVLLDPVHHDVHHTQDNCSYAFLNGLTDPILDPIAKHFYPGYKTTTDTHSGACARAPK